MKVEQLALFKLTKNKRALRAFSVKPPVMFCTRHSKTLMGDLINAETKNFYITDSTKSRISNMPIKDITGESLISLKDKKSVGFGYFSDGLHFIYSIRNNGVYIMTSRQKFVKFHEDPKFYLLNMMRGFLYYDFYSKDRACYINNILDLFDNKDNALKYEKSTMALIRRFNGSDDIKKQYLEDYNDKFNDTAMCLRAFLFIHFAKIVNTTTVSECCDMRTFTERIINKNVPQKIDVIRVDTFYDTSLKVINPFAVSGHFRNQPVGTGRCESKLIYIDEFMKTGYTRRATKEKINLD